eukprot:1170587-Pleurochrysis_carterae.AAC.1
MPESTTAFHITHYTVLVTAGADVGGPVLVNLTTSDMHAVVSPLFSGSMFGAQVRAHNRVGAGKWSARLLGTTTIPTMPPRAPGAARVLTDETSCDVRLLNLNAALPEASDLPEGHCAGAEQLQVQRQRAGSTHWDVLVPKAVGPTVVLRNLQPRTAHRFRLVALNRLSSSHAGVETPLADAVIPGFKPRGEAVQRPLHVKATSSESYVVSVPVATAPCQTDLAWTILVSLDAPADWPDGHAPSSQRWHVLGTALQGAKYEAEQLS